MFFRFFLHYFLFLIVFIGCNNDKAPIKTISMIQGSKKFYGRPVRNSSEKINSVVYNNKTRSIFFSIEPTEARQNSVFEIPFKPSNTLNLEYFSDNFKIQGHLTKRNRLIKSSVDGQYMAFGSWDGDLILEKNASPYFNIEYDGEITSLEFQDNLIAVGYKSGNISFYDLNHKKKHTWLKLFDGEITSIESFKNSQFFVSGVNEYIFLVDGYTGNILNKINTRTFKEKLLIASGLHPCIIDKINKIIYIPEKEQLITTHGWTYCAKPQIKIWDVKSWKKTFQIDNLDSQVYQMIWAPKSQKVIFADENIFLWTLNLDTFHVGNKSPLSKSINFFSKVNHKKKLLIPKYPIGAVNSLDMIPNTDIIIVGLGSYFLGGSGLLITQVNKSDFEHLVFFIKNNGSIYSFTPEINFSS